jgi:hypothetical protein
MTLNCLPLRLGRCFCSVLAVAAIGSVGLRAHAAERQGAPGAIAVDSALVSRTDVPIYLEGRAH